jgi:hypothetical protein
VTVTLAVELPPPFVAVSVYVVVAVGLTDVLVVPVTGPTPWSIESVVAPVTLQESVELAPGAIDAGDAVNDAITGTGTAVTVTVAVAVELPEEFMAVRV